MADVLRRLLDSGKLSDEKCHLILRGLGNLVDELYLPKNDEEEEDDDELYLSKNEEEDEDEEEEEEDINDFVQFILSENKKEEEEEKVEGWTSEEEEEFDEEYCRQVNDSLGFDIDGNVRIPRCGIRPFFLGDRKPRSHIALYGRLGVHCFNIEQTLVNRPLPRNGENLRICTEFCRIKPQTPSEETISLLDEQAIDKFYRGSMPKFVSKPGPDDDKLRFYEVQEQDICEYDWLRLYTEFALFSFYSYNEDGFESCLPVEEIKKILVETCETHSDPRLKLKSSNAIFHITFSAKSRNYKSVVRRTMDGISGHIVLEINSCRVDQPSSA
ncbi:hypothetical protein CARUB_v10017471mg [Capsella rubella]|uniref:Uncharacterized protein n=1 Tax=Capsella rubella TaxID=81985 RepID=R0HGG6_9BRAS|nr:hypothetical protein CARUB_v10017471mg [Capsella rubella]